MFFIDMVVMTVTSGASIVEIRFHDSPSSLLSSYDMSEKKKKPCMERKGDEEK